MSPIWNRIRGFPWRLIFLLSTAFGVLLFFYRALDRPARNQPVDWVEVFLEEMTGAYSGLPLLPLVAWLVLRFPLVMAAGRGIGPFTRRLASRTVSATRR